MIIRILTQWRRRRALLNIRHSMEFFGYPLNSMSDEEIESVVAQLATTVSSMGVTAAQAREGLLSVIQNQKAR